MRRRWAVLSLVLSLWGAARAETPVYFADPILQTAVEDELWVLEPTPGDMLGLLSLSCVNGGSGPGITDLTGLEYALNLQSLNVRGNSVTDISPLAGLVQLQTLIVNNNRITDLSPVAGLVQLEHLDAHENRLSDASAVAGLTALTYLNLHDNQISDISALSGLTRLTGLVICLNNISDISALSGLTCLQDLNLMGNQISDVTPLVLLTSLQFLNLGSNQISDVSPLPALTSLEDLDLSDNQITDIAPLVAFTGLHRLDLSSNPLSDGACDVYLPQIEANNTNIVIQCSCGPFAVSLSCGWGGCIVRPAATSGTYDYGASIWLEAEAIPGFAFSHWSGTIYGATNPYHLIVRSDHQIVANFVATSAVLYVDDDAAPDAAPGYTSDSDPQEDGTSDHPFDSIQEAIRAAADGTVIFVRPGVYAEHVDLLGKKIQLVALDPAHVRGGPCATIDGTDSGTPVTISAGAGSACSVSGFVITRGYGSLAGAISCTGSSPTISNCLIVGNRSTDPNGAAVHLSGSQATVTQCTIAGNYAGPNGAVLTAVNSSAAISNSIFWANTPYRILCLGTNTPSIRYCCVERGGLESGNIAWDPLFVSRGCWVSRTNAEVVLGPAHPLSVWKGGDYHLLSAAGRWDPTAAQWVVDAETSSCIDAGDPTSKVRGEPAPNGNIVNLGAYGATTEASKTP